MGLGLHNHFFAQKCVLENSKRGSINHL